MSCNRHFRYFTSRRSDGIAVGELGVNLGKNSSDVAVDNTEILELARKIARESTESMTVF